MILMDFVTGTQSSLLFTWKKFEILPFCRYFVWFFWDQWTTIFNQISFYNENLQIHVALNLPVIEAIRKEIIL